ncbi:MAG: hypothetical protein M3409_03300 [Gemmatimonadota bacterium]|nr:hypothetical protein [Gemmatimonadota bacterium]
MGWPEHEAIRTRLLREQARLTRSLERWAAEAAEHRLRVGERHPCAYLGAAAAREETDEASRMHAAERLELLPQTRRCGACVDDERPTGEGR